MAELGQTGDPAELVPGDPAAIYETETELRSYGDLMYSAGEGLKRIDTGDGWGGAAADAFRGVYHGQPAKWITAGDAFQAAANALNDYAGTLVWGQRQAAAAIHQWNAGDKRGAVETLNQARSEVSAAGGSASSKIDQAADLAPPKPGLLSRFGSDALGFLASAGHVAEGVGKDLVGGLASMGNAAVHDPGALLETAGGLGLAALGAAGEVGGGALDLTGVGAALGVPVNVVAAGGIASGLGLAGMGLHTMMSDAVGPDRVNMSDSGGSGGGTSGGGPGDGASSRIRPPAEGDTNYVVDNPDDLSDTITDIDRVQDGTLWEEKTATGQDPRMDTGRWVTKNVNGKLDSYVRARQYMPGYENAPLGLDFTQPGATPAFKQAVEQAVEQWKSANPGVEVTVRWAP